MGEVLGKLGYSFSPENLRVIWRIVDENRDGVLNFNEFLGFYDFLDFLKVIYVPSGLTHRVFSTLQTRIKVEASIEGYVTTS